MPYFLMTAQTEPFPALHGMFSHHHPSASLSPPSMLDHHGVLDPNPIADSAYEHNAVSGPLMDHGQVSSAMSNGSLSSEWYPQCTVSMPAHTPSTAHF